MAFLGGAECSTAGNPLGQFTKHVQQDKSFQRDRLVTGPFNNSLQGFRSAGGSVSQDEVVKGFLDQPSSISELPGELRPLSNHILFGNGQGPLRAQPASPNWANNLHSTHGPAETTSSVPPEVRFTPDDYALFQNIKGAASSSKSTPSPASPMASTQLRQPPLIGMTMMGMGMHSRPMYSQPIGILAPQMQAPLEQTEGKGKGKEKVVELDDHGWEEQFAQMELQDRQLREEDGSLAVETELNSLDEKLLHSETGLGDLESIWRGIQAERDALRGMDEAEEGFGKFDGSFGDWDTSNGRPGGLPMFEEYLFEEDNLFSGQSNPFEEGLRIMHEGGNLSLAALAFEAAAQQNSDHVDAWVHLGTAQAQNEKEDAAIRALERALRLDPTNLAALMGLAVSYTNEGYDSTAYRTLERWLSVKYPQIVASGDVSSAAELGFTDRMKLHEKVTDEFLKAARLSPDGEHMDPDVQVGLGVLFYGAEQYDKAVDCFEAALRSAELGTSNQGNQRHLLYNRLGATLANSGRSEEAIQAYEKALEINPNFVRARYNLGVSCINIGCPAQAADHLLTALEMHKSVEKSGREKAREILGGQPGVADAQIDAMAQNRSNTLYDTLRRVFTQMGRRDLAEKVVVGIDPEIFRGEFDF